jgi:hypothetical protein
VSRSAVQTAPPPVKAPEADPLAHPASDPDECHLWRRQHVHTVCGVPIKGGREGGSQIPISCGHCLRIGWAWLHDGLWEGFGPPPGREVTEELRWMLGGT